MDACAGDLLRFRKQIEAEKSNSVKQCIVNKEG
jgi:hypothetical protein